MKLVCVYEFFKVVSHLRASFKPGRFAAISPWLSEATPPELWIMQRRSRRDRSKSVSFDPSVAGILSGCVSFFARFRWFRSAFVCRLIFGISFTLCSVCPRYCGGGPQNSRQVISFVLFPDLWSCHERREFKTGHVVGRDLYTEQSNRLETVNFAGTIKGTARIAAQVIPNSGDLKAYAGFACRNAINRRT